MKEKVLMACGHVAQGVDCKGLPVCAVCIGINEGATVPMEESEMPDLTGRKAKCGECTQKATSRFSLPFFQHRKDSKFDQYYCGCRGWD